MAVLALVPIRWNSNKGASIGFMIVTRKNCIGCRMIRSLLLLACPGSSPTGHSKDSAGDIVGSGGWHDPGHHSLLIDSEADELLNQVLVFVA